MTLLLTTHFSREPESYAVWCITCLLVAATSNHYLRAMLAPDSPLYSRGNVHFFVLFRSPAILSSDTPNETQTFNILCAAASDFCRNNQVIEYCVSIFALFKDNFFHSGDGTRICSQITTKSLYLTTQHS